MANADNTYLVSDNLVDSDVGPGSEDQLTRSRQNADSAHMRSGCETLHLSVDSVPHPRRGVGLVAGNKID